MAISPGKPLISDFIGLTLRNGCLGWPFTQDWPSWVLETLVTCVESMTSCGWRRQRRKQSISRITKWLKAPQTTSHSTNQSLKEAPCAGSPGTINTGSILNPGCSNVYETSRPTFKENKENGKQQIPFFFFLTPFNNDRLPLTWLFFTPHLVLTWPHPSETLPLSPPSSPTRKVIP